MGLGGQAYNSGVRDQKSGVSVGLGDVDSFVSLLDPGETTATTV